MNEPNEVSGIEVQTAEPLPAAHYPPPPPIPKQAPPWGVSVRAPRAQPLLGPSFWVFGVLTWAYVVIGELVVHLGLPELLGALLVLGSTGYAWAVASGLGDGAPFSTKRLVPLALAGLFFVALMLLAVTIFGSHRRSYAAAVTILLWLVSVVAFLLGRHWTHRESSRRSTADGLRRAATWTFSVIATLIAMISAIDRM